ncbi:MAG: hypothetical protein WD097_08660 [Balneolales bacterium]
MRLLRFLLIFLGVAILVTGSIFLINRDAFLTVFKNREALLEGSEWVEKTYSLGGLIEFMDEQPQHVSMASFTTSSSDPAIRFHSDQLSPAGTLSNLFLIITYANQVATGILDPEAPVHTGRVKTFYLPTKDRRYQQTFEQWEQGFETPPSVRELVRYLIRHNDPAVADYLFFFLGEDAVTEWAFRLGDGYMEPPVPQFGLRMLALSQHQYGQSLSEHLAMLSRKDRKVLIEEAIAIAKQQWEHPATADVPAISSFQDERALHGHYPRIEPERFAGLVLAIWENTLINEETSTICRELLTQLPADHRLDQHVSEYAAQFDERMGYMSGWTLGSVPENETLRVQVILLKDLPPGLWFHINSNFMLRDYHNRMLYDPSLRDRTYSQLMTSE